MEQVQPTSTSTSPSADSPPPPTAAEHFNTGRTNSQRYYYGTDPSGVGFYWPESLQKRKEILAVKRNAPADFEAIYQGRPGQREGSIFIAKDIDHYYIAPAELSLGMASTQVSTFVRNGHCIAQAWDTAFSTSSQSAHTVCVTALFVPCNRYHCGEDPLILGEPDFHFDVCLLDVFRERLDWGGLVEAVRRMNMKWNPSEIIIENRASGISLIQSLENSGLPIVAVKATDSKGARALNSIGLQSAGSVQGWFRQHRVLCPLLPEECEADPEWYAGWRGEMMDFSGADDASSDRVDATVHLIQRAIIQGSSMAVLPSDWQPDRAALPARTAELARSLNNTFDVLIDSRSALLATIGMLPDLVEDPFYGLCGRCRFHNHSNNFCRVQQRGTVALDSCVSYEDEHGTASSI